MSCSYVCEGCGYAVETLALSLPPPHRFCIQCSFLSDYEDPELIMYVRWLLDAERLDQSEVRSRLQAVRDLTYTSAE